MTTQENPKENVMNWDKWTNSFAFNAKECEKYPANLSLHQMFQKILDTKDYEFVLKNDFNSNAILYLYDSLATQEVKDKIDSLGSQYHPRKRPTVFRWILQHVWLEKQTGLPFSQKWKDNFKKAVTQAKIDLVLL